MFVFEVNLLLSIVFIKLCFSLFFKFFIEVFFGGYFSWYFLINFV